ncbi:SDR family NAD(P)-dependent oxidoreductase [Staphylococcus americanisciuri]|uniref:SDR family NAD(P)-dependent oxidoreductase n=1 Tax=Staphylococcus americanisciuri TaxID=2973940 RepID=A0ABT2EZ29_9STAP|nr:SDR family NAD(P)-dependent oxidoreductase [Staphylococcus americanisciuri]MCS4485485.1 SDR family NAD(P)-dependent oxidoreductase [Staphylococcus americanisciuri]
MSTQHYIITGATSGLGYEITKQLYQHNIYLTLIVRDVEKAERLFPKLDYPNITWIACDMTSADDIIALSDQFSMQGKRYHGLIHSAGLGYFKSITNHTHTEMIQTYQVNTLHFVLLLKQLKPYLTHDATIVGISSQAAMATQPHGAHYAASKAAFNHILNALRFEEPSYHILNVMTGPIATPFHIHADPTGQYQQKMSRIMLQPQPLAAKIIQAMYQKKQEFYAPKWMAGALRIYQLAPRLFEKLGKTFFMSKMQ